MSDAPTTREFYESVLDTVHDGIYATDAEDRIVYFNRAMERISGILAEDALGKSVVADFPKETIGEFVPHYRRARETLQPAVFEAAMRLPSGQATVQAGTLAPRLEGGRYAGMIGSMRDVTDSRRAEKALEEKNTLLARAEELSKSGAWVLDLVEGTSHISENWRRILGVPTTDITWEEFQELIPEDDVPKVRKAFEGAMAGTAPYETLHRIVRKTDGACLHIHCRGEVVRDAQGRPIKVYGVSHDVTERKSAEEALAASERRLRHIFDNIQDVFYEVSLDGTIMEVSPSVETISRGQYKREDLLGMSMDALYDDPVQRESLLAELQAHGSVSDYEILLRNRNGSVVPCAISARIYRDSDDGKVHIVGSMRDISERKRAESELRLSEELLNETGSMARVGGWEVHLENNTVYWSRTTKQIHGVPEDYEPTLEEAIDFFPEQAHATIAEAVRKAREEGVPYDMELPFIDASGKRLWVRTIGKPTIRDGKCIRLHGTFQDITDLYEAGREREKLQNQLAQAHKMESIGRLAGGVAHDFNNMLNVILGNVEMVLDTLGAEDPARADLEQVRQAAERSADLTRQLLAFARRQTVMPKLLDLNDTIESMLKMLGRLVRDDIRLVWKPGRALKSVRIDPAQIDQMLANLVVNACDAMEGPGEVTIETRTTSLRDETASVPPGDYVLLVVRDTGCGMDAETRAQVFEPFFTTKEVGQGTGLGLATVYGIVSQNEGFVEVESEPGEGSAFRIYLPVDFQRQSPAPEAAQEASPVEPGNETILVVEDEKSILGLTRKVLERLGYHVLTAHTPGMAIEIARKHAGPIHLLITDVVMPEMNGRDLAKNLLGLYPDMQRIFMSGYTPDTVAHHGILEQEVHFLAKPFTRDQLGHKVREALGQKD